MSAKIEITATANKSNRTFTIRKFENGKLYAKYRTVKMDQNEFDSCLNNTENDWKQFLKSDDYFSI